MKTGCNTYLDTSVIANLLLKEAFSDRAEAYASSNRDSLVVSDFAAAEFSSVIARRVRTGEFSPAEARGHLADFDSWVGRAVLHIEIMPRDIAQAAAYMRRFDLALRTPDAIHVAVAWRLGASLATFDRRMADAARTLDVSVADT